MASKSDSEMQAIQIAERTASVLSVLGATIVILTFTLSKSFRKPINRLVFYATFGNLFANVATIISTSGPEMGSVSGLCQFQAFLIQWSVGKQ
jgi:predicted secreted Zn-dependent protease